MMNLPLICIMLLTPKTIINQMTKKANRFLPTTTLSSSFKINDNDHQHHELLNVPNPKTITLFTPPLAVGEHFHESRKTQSEQTAEYICTSGINGPEIQYGTVRSASRQPELNCYHTTETNETNEYINYPRGADTEGGVIKEGYANPVLAKIVEPPEGQTLIPMAITKAIINFNVTVCHHGEETEGVAKTKHSVPVLKRPIEPPERGGTNTLEIPVVPPDKPTTFQLRGFDHYEVICKAKRKKIKRWFNVICGQSALSRRWRTDKQLVPESIRFKFKWVLQLLLQLQLLPQRPRSRLLQPRLQSQFQLLPLLQRLPRPLHQIPLRPQLRSASGSTAAAFHSLIQSSPFTVNAMSNPLLAPHNYIKPARVTAARNPTGELLPVFSHARNWTGDVTTCPRPAPFDGVGAKTDE